MCIDRPPTDTDRVPPAKEWLLAGAVMAAALTALFIGPFLSSDGDVLGRPGFDMIDVFFPWRTYAAHTILSGQLPLWNAHTFCGAPFAANPETAIFYPFNVIFLILNFPLAANVSILFHLWLTGLLTWAFARTIGCRFGPAVLAAFIFVGCGANLPRLTAGHLSNINTLTWLPAVMLAAEQIMHGGGRRWIGAGAASIALMILAGHTQYFYFTMLYLLAYCTVRTMLTPRTAEAVPSAVTRWRNLGAMITLGVALAAVQLALSIPVALQSNRATMPDYFASSMSWSPVCLLDLLIPNFFFWNASPLGYWGPGIPWEMTAYLGMIPLILIAHAVWTALRGAARDGAPPPRQIGITRALTVAGAAMIILSLAHHTFFFSTAYQFIPGLRLFRGWSKFLAQASFSAAVLAALSFHWLSAAASRSRVPIVVGILLAVGTICVVHFCGARIMYWIADMRNDRDYVGSLRVSNTTPAVVEGIIDAWRAQAWNACIFLAWGVIFIKGLRAPRFKTVATWGVVLACGIDLALAHSRFITTFGKHLLYDQPLVVGQAADTPLDYRIYIDREFSADMAMTCNFLTPNGAPSTFPADVADLSNAVNGRPMGSPMFWIRLRDPEKCAKLFAIKYIFRHGQLLPTTGFVPRVRLIPAMGTVATREDAWNLLRAAPDSEPVLEGTPEPVTGALHLQPGRARIVAEDANRLQIETWAPQASWLYVADTWDAAWTCDVDGVPTPIRKANVAFRAVRVPQGTHTATFVYRPRGLYPGALISLAAIGVLVVMLRASASSSFSLPTMTRAPRRHET